MGAPIMPTVQLNAAFLIVDGVYNSELVAPMDVLHHTKFHTEKGINVFTVSEHKDPVTTFEGLKIIPDFSFKQDSLPAIDILIVPSAQHSMDSDLENQSLIDFVKMTGKKSSYVMSLCDGAFVLAKAGLLDLYECTTFPGDIEKMRQMFTNLSIHEKVSFVHDRTMITSSGGAKSYDPALYLVELLYGKKVADGIATGLVIDWDLNKINHLVVN
jgi:transcriptional regulator GlxA family with amidase domain